MKTTALILFVGITSLFAGCHSSKSVPATSQTVTSSDVEDATTFKVVREIGSQAMLPKATAFRMSGDYAGHVGVTLNSDGTLLYYPAPSDITSNSTPVALKEGWYLNRQGIGAGSVFTQWTFEEYSKLKATPSQEEILKAIIPGARVIDFEVLPVNLSEAISDPEICTQYLKH